MDTDAFTHLSLGREILHHRGFPAREPFNYPSFDHGFYNSEWLFGLVLYLTYTWFSVSGVIALKAVLVTAACYVLLKDSLIPRNNILVSVIILFFAALMMRYRFVERPDIALMFFLSFVIFALNAYVYEGRKYIYVLPALQVFWVNIHPSVALIIVPFCAFIVGGLVQRALETRTALRFSGTPTYRQISIMVGIFLLCLATSLLNPYTYHLFYAPAAVTGSTWWTDEIIELKAPAWILWKSPFLWSAAVLCSFLIPLWKKRLSLIHLAMVLPFLYIGFSAARFTFLICLVGAPVIVRNINAVAADGGRLVLTGTRAAKYSAAVATILGIVVISALTLAGKGLFRLPDKTFGLHIVYERLPEGALNYLDKRGLEGRIFNTFQWGGYISWRDHPKRTTFVDGRGGIADDLREAILSARFQPGVLNRLSEKYGFKIVLLHYNPSASRMLETKNPDVDLGLFAAPKDWALVYWDDTSMVYLKRVAELKTTIDEDEYRFIRPANGYTYIAQQLRHHPERQEGIAKELARNVAEAGSWKARLFLGFVYNSSRDYAKTIELLNGAKDFEAYQSLGVAYKRTGALDDAITCYKKAANIEKSPAVLYNLGDLYVAKDDLKKGIYYLKAAIEKDQRFLAAYPPLLEAYHRMGRQDEYDLTKTTYQNASLSSEAKAIFDRGIKLTTEGKRREAITEFLRFVETAPSNPAGHNNLGYLYYLERDYDGAYREFTKTLDINPQFPNAYYGLGLIYKKRGDAMKARTHFEQYLTLEPSGTWSRKAREELQALKKSGER